MLGDDPPADRQAQAQARLPGADERLEDPFAEVSREARALVGHADREPAGRRVRPRAPRVRLDRDPDRPALGGRIQGVHDQVEEDLADLTRVGLHEGVAARRLRPERHALQLRPPGEEGQGLSDRLAQVERPTVQGGRPGEIEERLERPLHPQDLLLEHGQAPAVDRASFTPVGGGLDEDLDGRERVPQLMGQARRELPQRRELFGPQCLAAALLQPVDDPPDLVGDPPEGHFQGPDITRRRDGDRPHHLLQAPRRVADRDAELHDRAPHRPGDPEPRDEPGDRPAGAEQQEAERHPTRHRQVLPVGPVDHLLVEVQIL